MQSLLEILVIEDNPGDVRLIEEFLLEKEIIKFHFLKADTLKSGIDILKKEKVDIVLVDLGLPDCKGLETFRQISKVTKIPIIIMTGTKDEKLAVSALHEGAQDYLVKDEINGGILSRSILYAIERKKSENLVKEYAFIVENAEEAIIGLTLEGVIVNWNSGAEKILGFSANEMIGKSIAIFLPEENKEEITNILRAIAEGEKIDRYEATRLKKNGEEIILSIVISSIRNEFGRIIGASVIAHDITALKLNEQQLAIQYRISLALSEAINLNNAANSIMKAICEILEWQVGEVWILDPSANKLKYMASWFSKSNFKELKPLTYQLTFRRGEGLPGYIWQTKTTYWISNLKDDVKSTRSRLLIQMGLNSCLGFPIFYHDEVLGVVLFFGERIRQPLTNFLAMFTGIGSQMGTFIKRKRAEGDLLYLAQHDSLTGLSNRAALEESLNIFINNAQRRHNLVGILYLDLDYFKKVNDSMGHAKGDSLLQEVAIRLRQCVRDTDIVARFGGDEFTILLPFVSTRESIIIFAKKILNVFQKPFKINGTEFYVTASIGISIYPNDGNDVQTLMRNADMAMYYAKMRGRNNYQFCPPNIGASALEKVNLENELHRALMQNEFILYYQPQIDIKTNTIVGLETLIRWCRPDGSIMMPSEFIPLAEELNLILPIGEWAIRTAARQNKLWQELGLEPITVSVNVSGHQLGIGLVKLISDVLAETALDPKYLELELTETTLMQNTEANISLLRAIKELGVKISIDDFGKEYSSLAYLKTFSIDALKIDYSFVSGLPKDPNARAIVLAIIAMARSINVNVIAEGVERKDQLDFLTENACDQYQGFYFSKPLPAEEIYKILVK